MKNINSLKISTLLILFITIFIVNCSKGTSDDVIKKLVKEKWVNLNLDPWKGGENIYIKGTVNLPREIKSIDNIEIEERGKLSEDGKKQHYIIIVKGIARMFSWKPKTVIPTEISEPDESFTARNEYLFYKDDYGDWKLNQIYK